MNFAHSNNVISTENQIIHVTTARNEPPGTTVGLKSVDLVSVTSSEFNDDDNISFDEGRLQQWSFDEFWAQMKSASAAIVLLVACCIHSTWSINEYLKLLLDEEDETSTWNDTDSTSGYDLVDQLFTSESVTVTTVIISWNIGAIFGGVLGAFIVPVLTNKIIYVSGWSVFVGIYARGPINECAIFVVLDWSRVVSIVQWCLIADKRQRLSIHQGAILSRTHAWTGAVGRHCASSRIDNEKSSSPHVDNSRLHVHTIFARIDSARASTGQNRLHLVPGA